MEILALTGVEISLPLILTGWRKGVRCTASYITNPPCCPSRCSMLMGQYGKKFGKYGMSRGLSLPDDRPTLAQFLSGQGYVTGHIGKWDIGSRAQGPLQTGFSKAARTSKRSIPRGSCYLSPSPAESWRKEGKSKYYCIDEGGKTMWLTDYDGDAMVDFVQQHKTSVSFSTGRRRPCLL